VLFVVVVALALIGLLYAAMLLVLVGLSLMAVAVMASMFER
jgi:hypothetical protein